MSSSSYIHLKRAGTAKAPDGLDGYTAVFPWAQGALDTMAASLGVRRPTEFVFASRAAYEDAMGGEVPKKLRKQFEAQQDWHDAAAGLATFAALKTHLETQRAEAHKVIGEHNDLDSVLLTVDVMRRILETAAKDGDSFRIEHEF
jgi:hypothetical protein